MCDVNKRDFLNTGVELKTKCLKTLCNFFAQLTFIANHDLPFSSLHIDGFGLEDIWEQIELVNEPMLSSLHKYIKVYKRRQFQNLIVEAKNGSTIADADEGGEEVAKERTCSSDNEGMFQYASSTDDANLETRDTGDHFFNLADMNEFVKQAENQTSNGDIFSEDSDEMLEEITENKDNMYYYKDFFDPLTCVSDQDTHILSKHLSTHEKKQEKMKGFISQLEEANMHNRLWQMSGEISSKERDENTVLEEHLLFEHLNRSVPEITEEVTVKLEDMIKQRIKDKIWDDVLPKTKPKQTSIAYKALPSLNVEKSKLSLADVYEQEYINQTQAEKSKEENLKQVEIKSLLTKLFHELDALSNYRFVPLMPDLEIKPVPHIPSLTMEEVNPPEEIQLSDAIDGKRNSLKPDTLPRETDYELETPVAAPSSITNDSSNDTDIVTVTYL